MSFSKSDIVTFIKAVSTMQEGMSYRKFCLVALGWLVFTGLSGQDGPGGVGNSTNNLLWLKADAGTSTGINGNPVSLWLDQSGNGMDASQGNLIRQPKFVANAVNGKPSILLNNADGFYDNFTLPAGFNDFSGGLSAFVVLKPNSSIARSNFFNLGGGTTSLSDEAISFSFDTNPSNFLYEVANGGLTNGISRGTLSSGTYQILAVRQDGGTPPTSTTTRLFKNNTQILGSALVNLPSNILRNDNYIGHNSWGTGDIDAEIAEIIIYNYSVNIAQRNIVSNYLSSKYNISIGILTDRYSYDVAYGYDVAGIGQADADDLHDNATSSGILNISNPGSLDNGDYLLFGHNNGSSSAWEFTSVPTDILNLSFLRIPREWRVDKTNDVGIVTITGDYSHLPVLPAGYAIRCLLVDSDGDFTSGAVPYVLTDIGSGKYQVNGVTLNDGDYLTFAAYMINNEDACNALAVNVAATCTFQQFSNGGASDSSVEDPGNCDGTGNSGYSGGDVWFKVTVPSSGNIEINTGTESVSVTDPVWASRIGIAVYSGTCVGLTKIDCQISPATQVPPGNVDLSITGRTPGETLLIRMWEYGNDNNGKFELCIYDACLLPPVITGSIEPTTVEGCMSGNVTPAVTSVIDLEAMGLNISDGCTPDASLIVTHSDAFSGTCPIVVTRTYTITNAGLSHSTYKQVISVDDNTPPVIVGTLTPITVEGCNISQVPAAVTSVAALEAFPGGITITDACTPDLSLNVTHSDVSGGTCPIVIKRTYTIRDACGNLASILQLINIDDTQAPVVTGSIDPMIVEGCDEKSAPAAVKTVADLEVLPGGITINDACALDASLTVTHTDVITGTCPMIITRVYTVTDACNNFVNISHTIHINDNTPPVVVGTLSPEVVEGCNYGDAPTAAVSVAELEALAGGISISDGCTPDASLRVSHSDLPGGACPIVIDRTYTVSDACNNSVNINQTIRIVDTKAPVVTGTLAPVTVEGCDSTAVPAAANSVAELEALTGNITITDACTPSGSLSVIHSDTQTGICPLVINRIYTITDVCGNSFDINQLITVIDITYPTFTTPPDITIFRDVNCGYDKSVGVTGDVTDEADNCDTSLDAIFSDIVSAGSCAGEQIITRTWSLSDNCGNTTNHIQIITVRDSTPPTFSAPPVITIYTNGSCGYDSSPAITGDVTDEKDNCDNTLNAVFTDVVSDGSCQGDKLIVRTWSLTDGCGNKTTHDQIINVRDNIPPSFKVPADKFICRNNDCTYSIDPIITGDVIDEKDNCSTGLNATYTDDTSGAPDCNKAGIVLRTWSLTDNCGNSAVDQIQTIYINPIPSISVIPDNAVLCHTGDSVNFNITTSNTLNNGSKWLYDVSVTYPTVVTGTLSGGLSDQTKSLLTDKLLNSGNTVQTVVYLFTPHIEPGDGSARCQNGTPAVVTVEVDPQPKITVTTDPVLCHDGTATFNISTVNTSVSNGGEWLYDVAVIYPALVTGTLSGGLYNITSLSLTDNLINTGDVVQTVIYSFTPHIRPGDGGPECIKGIPANITVKVDPQPKITVNTDRFLCQNDIASFNISTVNTSVSSGGVWHYDVHVDYPVSVTGTMGGDLYDQTSFSLVDNLSNSSDIAQTVMYTFTPHIRPGDGGSECLGGIPVVISVMIDPQPRITVTTDQTLCYDGDATFNISTVNTSVSSGGEWRYDLTVNYPALVTGDFPSGVTDLTLLSLTDNLTNNSDVAQSVTYTFTPHIRPGDSGPECRNGIPAIVTVVLNPRPKITVTTDPVLCFNESALFNISTTNTSISTGGLWHYDVTVTYPPLVTGDLAGGLTGQTSASLTDNLVNGSDIMQTVVYTFTPHITPGDGGSECQGGIPVVVRISIDPQPKITVTTEPVLCFDGDATFNISTVNTSLSSGGLWHYDVSVTYPASVTGDYGGGIINHTSPVLTDNLTNNGDVVQTVVYTFTPHIRPGDGGAECLNGLSSTITLQINPQPRVFPIPPNTIQCDSTLTSITLGSPSIFSTGLITFDQTVAATGNVSGYTPQLDGLDNNHLIADRLVNRSDTFQTVTYKITPVSPTGCLNGPAVNIKVIVNPTPTVIPVNNNFKPDSSVCFDENTRIVLTSPTVMTSGAIRFDYNVTFSGAPGIITGNTSPATDLSSGYAISYPYQNNSDTIQSVYFYITPKVNTALCLPGKTVRSEIKVHPNPLQDLLITKPLTCGGGSDAVLLAVTSKGAELYYFDWVRTLADQVHGYNIPELINSKGGRWDVKVTDNLGCSNSGFIIVQGAIPDSYMNVIDSTGYGTTCPGSNDGEIWIKVNDSSTGVPPYEYWVVRNGQDTVIHSILPANGVIQKWNNMSPGVYKLYLRDSNGCYDINYREAIIDEPDSIAVTFDKSVYPGGDNVSCNGYNNGSVWITSTTGGNGGYHFKWHTNNGTISGSDTLNRLDNITAGTYYLVTTDRKGCAKTDSVIITQPDGMQLISSDLYVGSDGTYNISCNGGSDGSIILNITGGTSNYKYSWSGPDLFTATTGDISGLKAGDYSCTVTDVNGCILTPSPLFHLTEPPLLSVTFSLPLSIDGTHNINCYGGAVPVNIAVSGGITGTYQYSWSTSDGSGIVAGLEDQDALTAGTYHLKVTDLNGCESAIDFTLSQPDSLKSVFSVKNITCKSGLFDDGSIDLSVTGGIAPYTFMWSNGQGTEDISGLTRGYYRVLVTDSNGCSRTDSALVELPPPLTYTKKVSDYNGYNISCNGLNDGFINITPTNGTPPFDYQWTGPAPFSETGQNISVLKAGTYVLTITDNNFCTATETFILTEPGKLGMDITLSTSFDGGFNINCAGSNSGSINVEPLNYVKTIEYLWSDGIFGKTRNGLAAGDYYLIITDANGCHANDTITLTEPDSIKIDFIVTHPFCPDKPDGQINLAVTGGVMGTSYIYRWKDNSTDEILTDVHTGFYSVTVTDFNGCSVKDSVWVDPLNKSCLRIPNAITPNGDLINDVWRIGMIELYPQVDIIIFNRWGETVWRSARGYPEPWDGRSNGKALPVDSYHYIIDLHNGSKLIIGNVTIVR